MSEKSGRISRRGFFRYAGAVGAGGFLGFSGGPALLTAGRAAAMQAEPVPTRPFGRTGVQVPVLSLGGIFDTRSNHLLLRQALRWGVSYWDTAESYLGGRSEEGMGEFFERYPQERGNVFLVTKSGTRDPYRAQRSLEGSLERLRTDYVDLFFVHGARRWSGADKDLRRWVERAKASGRIRFFGFSTHTNMSNCMISAAREGFVDGIMMTYNFRLMFSDDMRRAVEACREAGIGLTAMKTQGGGPVVDGGGAHHELAERFLERGYSEEQVKLKAVWENGAIASICSQMPNVTILLSNVAAALDRTSLSAADRESLAEYARSSSGCYCAGCGDLCESAIGRQVPVSDVMRCLMYDRWYGDVRLARQAFAELPWSARSLLGKLDYTEAERCCPQGLPIGRLMREAERLLT